MNVSYTNPAISVVVPCRNESDHIEACVQSILAQEPPPGGFEIIVADGMSDDGTREILEKMSQTDSRLIVVDNPDRTTPYGMNAGIRRARGEYIAIMGAHHYYASDYLQLSFEVLQKTAADNVGGSLVYFGESWVQRAIAIAHHSPFSVGGARWHDANYEGPADTVFGGVYRREVFQRIGLFDERLVRNQDDEFNLRLTRAGGKIWHSPRIKSWTRPRESLKDHFRQYMQYGYWKVPVIQKHGKPASPRHLVPGSFVLSLIVLPLIGLFWPPALWISLGIGLVYLCGIGIASVITAAKHGWKYLPILPLVFACYHLGYGTGFIKGVVDFLILGRVPADRFTTITRSSIRSSPRS